MLREILLIFAVFVAVDGSLLGFGLEAVDNRALPSDAVISIKQANTKCACRNQCVLDNTCTAVTTFMTTRGSFECHFSSAPHENGITLVDDSSKPSISTLLKVKVQTFTTPTTTTTTTPTTTTTTTPTTTPTTTTTTTPTTTPTTTTITTPTTTPTTTTTTTPTTTVTTTTTTTLTTTPTSCTPDITVPSGCDAPFISLPPHGCFYFSTLQKNFDDASKSCPYKSTLAAPSDSATFSRLASYMTNCALGSNWWVNIRMSNDGIWRWADGVRTVEKVLPWTTSAPNDGGSTDTARMTSPPNYGLNDMGSSTSCKFICKFNP